jgi:thioredoxin 1
MSKEVKITADNFEAEVLNSSLPVLLDFWADWCMPCKMIAPSLEEMSEAYEGKLKIGKINVDQEGDLAQKYGIISIPTLLLFKDGAIVKNHVGAAPKTALEELVKSVV